MCNKNKYFKGWLTQENEAAPVIKFYCVHGLSPIPKIERLELGVFKFTHPFIGDERHGEIIYSMFGPAKDGVVCKGETGRGFVTFKTYDIVTGKLSDGKLFQTEFDIELRQKADFKL